MSTMSLASLSTLPSVVAGRSEYSASTMVPVQYLVVGDVLDGTHEVVKSVTTYCDGYATLVTEYPNGLIQVVQLEMTDMVFITHNVGNV